MPEYEQLNSGHNSFLQSPSHDQSPSSFQSFSQQQPPDKKSTASSASHSPKNEKSDAKKLNDYAQPNIRMIDHDTRRPSSYYTAMENARDSKNISHHPSPSRRPKAVYQSSLVYDKPVINPRSKSEAPLEANFDETDEK